MYTHRGTLIAVKKPKLAIKTKTAYTKIKAMINMFEGNQGGQKTCLTFHFTKHQASRYHRTVQSQQLCCSLRLYHCLKLCRWWTSTYTWWAELNILFMQVLVRAQTLGMKIQVKNLCTWVENQNRQILFEMSGLELILDAMWFHLTTLKLSATNSYIFEHTALHRQF